MMTNSRDIFLDEGWAVVANNGRVYICAANPIMREYTLCGMAFDAFDSQDTDEPIVFAEQGQRVTCPQCRRAIRLTYEEYTKGGLVR